MGNNITNKRIDELDYIRGFALLGIILVNILALLNIKIPDPNTVDASYQRFLYLFVEGRFFSIFSFLFGVGFYIFISRAIAKGKNGYVLFLRRVVALFTFGYIHQMFQPGEALTLYAIYGLIVLPFYKAKKEVNLVIGLILTITFSILAAKEFLPLGLILLGLAAGQYQVFENLSQKIKKVAIFTGFMFVLSLIGLWYQYEQVPALPFDNIILDGVNDPNIEQSSKFLQIGITVGPIISAFYVGALILLLQLKPVQTLLAPLKYYGRMALTNYIGQTAMILIAGSVFNFAENLTYMQTLYVCIAVYAIQIVFSVIWMKIFRMGPLEWIWRVITYWTVTPLKK
ncbi:TPA: DUF418 domain-containing protein [Bacillus cereus]|uniref:DUF418 domain-containing protein n=1 Tax=Bacillus cereus TaxID=1396 RepID=A0A1D3NRM2_BACCE|nr:MULTISPECIES: DUF418 domain-containing protein [Bacillus]MCG3424646.1 DUF418 domain-containing protein [Bacillus thuringiensis]MCP1180907.1 DUF418 domain-containing protein [Bacillus sp. 1663tsa1]MCP1282688.1 DUF418 domain-containing protein [Bacillus sp. S0635]MCQ6347106.1 DUF418 domain-containing protein [Bacillus cereus]MCU5459569.1 DUF418 domain-containing protein [Bacillus cereus]